MGGRLRDPIGRLLDPSVRTPLERHVVDEHSNAAPLHCVRSVVLGLNGARDERGMGRRVRVRRPTSRYPPRAPRAARRALGRHNVARRPEPVLAGTGSLQGISAVFSPTDIWAVGGYTTDAGATQTLIGVPGTAPRGRSSPGPNRSPSFSVLRSVHGVTAGNAWAVGSATIVGKTTTTVPLIEHWHAGAWHVVKGPTLRLACGRVPRSRKQGRKPHLGGRRLLDSSIPAKRTLIEEFVNGN